MRVACVLKSGPEYKPVHVHELAESILAHNDVRIDCYTDCAINHPGVNEIPLVHGWPGWWSKIELFRECAGPTLYLDLDTVVLGELPQIGKNFSMLPDVYRSGDFGSGVMSWQKTPVHLYETFINCPEHFMGSYRSRRNWGDQAFIRDYLRETPSTFGDEFRSYKAHCRKKVPRGTKVVYFHGKPRPWEVKLCLT